MKHGRPYRVDVVWSSRVASSFEIKDGSGAKIAVFYDSDRAHAVCDFLNGVTPAAS